MSELAEHGTTPVNGIRFELNKGAMKVLDLTDPAVAAQWGYAGGESNAASRALGQKALNGGYNAIKFTSERVPGAVNYAVLEDFEKILNAKMVTPAKP